MDPELEAALPERIRSILARTADRRVTLSMDPGWQAYHAQLDRVVAQPDAAIIENQSFAKTNFIVEARLTDGILKIRFPSVNSASAKQYGKAVGGMGFTYFMGSTIDWLAKNRKASGILRIEIEGGQLQNLPMIELLESLGFKKRPGIGICAFMSTLAWFGGYTVGTLGQLALGSSSPTEMHPISFWSANGAAALGFTFGCVLGKKEFDYRLTIHPEPLTE